MVSTRHRRTPEPGRHRRKLGDHERRARRRAPPPPTPTRRCSGSPRRSSASRSRASRSSNGVVSGGGKHGHVRPADRRQAVQRRDAGQLQPAATARRPPSAGPGLSRRRGRSRSASTRSSAPPGPPRIDIPQGDGHLHLHPQRPRPGDAARPHRPAARAGRLRRRHEPRCSQVDPSSISAHPGRAGRPDRTTSSASSRRTSTTRSRRPPSSRSPGRRCRCFPGDGNLWEQMRSAATAPARPPTIAYGATSATSTRRSPRRRRRSPTTFTYPYNGHVPIGPTCAVADVTPSERDRALATPRTLQHARSLAAPALRAATCPRSRSGSTYYEGSSVVRGRHLRRRGQAAAIMSQASASRSGVQFMRWDEHGWDNYGPRAADRRSRRRSTRTATSSATTTRSSASRLRRPSVEPAASSGAAAAPLAASAGSADTTQLGHAVQRSRTGA